MEEKGVALLPVPPMCLHCGIRLPSKIGLAGGKGLVTNLLITEDVLLTSALMGCNNSMLLSYLVGGSPLLGC